MSKAAQFMKQALEHAKSMPSRTPPADDELAGSVMAESLYRVYRIGMGAIGVELPEEIDMEQGEIWQQVTGVMSAKLDEVTNKPWKAVAAEAFAVYADAADLILKWEQLDPKQQAVWEAVVRHLVNLLDLDDTAGIEFHEQNWGTWVQGKIGEA